MHIVFVHRHGPGQFVHLARRLISDGWTATLICESMDRPVPGLRVFRYGDKPGGQGRSGEISGKGSVPYIVAGRRVADILNKLSLNGRKPDLVMGHIGWGGMLFVKDALPDVPAIGYCEYYFQPQGGDLGFAPTEEVSLHHRQTVRLRNTVQLATLDQIDIGISPTAWQKPLPTGIPIKDRCSARGHRHFASAPRQCCEFSSAKRPASDRRRSGCHICSPQS